MAGKAKQSGQATDRGAAAADKGKRRGCCCKCCGFYFSFIVFPILFAALANIVLNATTEGNNGWGGVPRTLEEETAMCPKWVMWALSQEAATTASAVSAVRHEAWAGDYFIGFKFMADALLSLYAPRHAEHVKIPTMTGSPPNTMVASVVAPDRDIDAPMYLVVERFLPSFIWRMLFTTFFNCGMGVIRNIDSEPFDDMMDNTVNSWPLVLSGQYAGQSKRSFLLSYWDNRTLWDKTKPRYPYFENDLTQLFHDGGMWDDALEKSLAFDLIGAHRIEVAEKNVGGETLRFVLPFNSLSKVETRPGFGKYGGDMYFTAEGLPALIVTTDGREVMRGDKDWQYWKFVWRCTLLGTITLIDHLHLTHFRSSNLLAKATRTALPANHPLRRFMSIFTFGSVFINNIAIHLLAGHRSPLHRSTPFKEFGALEERVPTLMKPLRDWHRRFEDDAEWDKMPNILKETPYYSDGRLLNQEVKKMVDKMAKAMGFHDCKSIKSIKDVSVVRFIKEIQTSEAVSGYDKSLALTDDCASLNKWLQAAIWTVTGWHRHVGHVADFMADPDLAGFAWKEGVASTPPRQAMIMSAVAAFTGSPHPKLIEDYTHLFVGVEGGEKMTEIWHEFQKGLHNVEEEIDRRNSKRHVKNGHSKPSIVECSVAV